MNQKKQRNSSIELLRIIAAIAVVLLHYINPSIGGGFAYVRPGINKYAMYIVESTLMCAVDLFVLISAYFLSATQKRKMIKVMEMIIQVIFFRCLFYAVELLLGATFSVKILISKILPSNWFVILYIVLYILSPYINILIGQLSKEGNKKFTATVFLIFSVWTISVDFLEAFLGMATGGLNPVGMTGSQNGYTIVNFVLMYIIGAYIRTNNVSLSKPRAFLGLAISAAGVVGSLAFEAFFDLGATNTWNYNHPIVIAMAVFAFLLFKEIHFDSKIINELAKGALTCYIIHGDYMIQFGVPAIEKAVSSNVFIMILHQLLVGTSIYLVSYVVYKVYSLISKKVISLIAPWCDRVDLSVQ